MQNTYWWWTVWIKKLTFSNNQQLLYYNVSDIVSIARKVVHIQYRYNHTEHMALLLQICWSTSRIKPRDASTHSNIKIKIGTRDTFYYTWEVQFLGTNFLWQEAILMSLFGKTLLKSYHALPLCTQPRILTTHYRIFFVSFNIFMLENRHAKEVYPKRNIYHQRLHIIYSLQFLFIVSH